MSRPIAERTEYDDLFDDIAAIIEKFMSQKLGDDGKRELEDLLKGHEEEINQFHSRAKVEKEDGDG